MIDTIDSDEMIRVSIDIITDLKDTVIVYRNEEYPHEMGQPMRLVSLLVYVLLCFDPINLNMRLSMPRWFHSIQYNKRLIPICECLFCYLLIFCLLFYPGFLKCVQFVFE
jgi:hypothetical protein